MIYLLDSRRGVNSYNPMQINTMLRCFFDSLPCGCVWGGGGWLCVILDRLVHEQHNQHYYLRFQPIARLKRIINENSDIVQGCNSRVKIRTAITIKNSSILKFIFLYVFLYLFYTARTWRGLFPPTECVSTFE